MSPKIRGCCVYHHDTWIFEVFSKFSLANCTDPTVSLEKNTWRLGVFCFFRSINMYNCMTTNIMALPTTLLYNPNNPGSLDWLITESSFGSICDRHLPSAFSELLARSSSPPWLHPSGPSWEDPRSHASKWFRNLPQVFGLQNGNPPIHNRRGGNLTWKDMEAGYTSTWDSNRKNKM